MVVVPLPFGKSVLDRPNKAIEKHSITSQSAYARYPAPGDSLRSSGPRRSLHSNEDLAGLRI